MIKKEYKTVPLTHIQKIIGKRMLESKKTKPCFYIELNADVSYLMKYRTSLRKGIGVKITTNTFYLHAIGFAAAKFPLMLASFAGDTIKIPDSVNIGFAVSAPHGLVVPVIKNIQDKNITQIAIEENDLTEKARNNSLAFDDMQGENIAVSNLGPYGIDSFIAIVPPHASSIIAIGNVDRRVTIVDNRPDVARKVSLTLAADNRVVTPVYAAKFLTCIKQLLENPQSLVEDDA